MREKEIEMSSNRKISSQKELIETVLHRAIELEESQNPKPLENGNSQIDIQEAIELGKQIGISPRTIEQAMIEVHQEEGHLLYPINACKVKEAIVEQLIRNPEYSKHMQIQCSRTSPNELLIQDNNSKFLITKVHVEIVSENLSMVKLNFHDSEVFAETKRVAFKAAIGSLFLTPVLALFAGPHKLQLVTSMLTGICTAAALLLGGMMYYIQKNKRRQIKTIQTLLNNETKVHLTKMELTNSR